MKVILAPSVDIAASISASITVEAEYGATVIKGSRYTAAHHQPVGSPFAGRHVVEGGRPSPCNDTNIPQANEEDTLLASHLDLDSLGGLLRAIKGQNHPLFSEVSFWNLAEFVDVTGPHKLHRSNANDVDIRRLYAWWVWAKTGLPRITPGQATDVTDIVENACVVLTAIFEGDPLFLLLGDTFRSALDDLNARTFVRLEGDVIVRKAVAAGDFCNHLYHTPTGESARAVASLNTATGSVTISLQDSDSETVSCRDLLQTLWGMDAGGHKGIGGSPRGEVYGTAHLEQAVAELVRNLKA